MMVEICDSDGDVGEWASLQTAESVLSYLKETGNEDLIKFSDEGCYDDPEYLVGLLKGLNPPAEIVAAVDELISLAGKCNDDVILSTGE